MRWTSGSSDFPFVILTSILAFDLLTAGYIMMGWTLRFFNFGQIFPLEIPKADGRASPKSLVPRIHCYWRTIYFSYYISVLRFSPSRLCAYSLLGQRGLALIYPFSMAKARSSESMLSRKDSTARIPFIPCQKRTFTLD